MQYTDVEKPVPGAGEVLVEIHAAALNAYDWHLLRADPFLARSAIGLVKPSVTILGADIAGRVEATGDDVTQDQPGDEVFGDIAAYGAGGPPLSRRGRRQREGGHTGQRGEGHGPPIFP